MMKYVKNSSEVKNTQPVQVQPDDSLRRPRTEVLWFKDGELLDTTPKKYRHYGMKKRLLIRWPLHTNTSIVGGVLSIVQDVKAQNFVSI